MASRNQEELPKTRRDDEPPPFKPIKALEDNIAEWQKLLGRRKKLNQEIIAKQIQQQELLVQHDRPSYPYESASGGERELYRNESVKSRKVLTKAEAEPGKKKRGKKADEGTGDEAKE